MEALYAKLYDKYAKLKKDKESQFDKLNHDQEVKFLNYAAAADEMIQYLKTENDRLQGQVDELKSELASFRSSSDEQHIHYQKLLMEESQKNKELSEEIARLQKLEHSECSRCNMHEATVRGQQNSCEDTRGDERPDNSVMESRKKRKFVHTPDRMIDVESDRPADQHVYGDKGSGIPPIPSRVFIQPDMDKESRGRSRVMARRRYDIVLHMFDEQDMLPRVDPRNERIHVVCDEDVLQMFHRNVVTAEVHVWIHVELITPLGAELHVIDLDAEEDDETEGVEAEGVDQGAEDVQVESAADETHVEDDENAMHDECNSVRGDKQTNEDEDDGLMSGYSSDDAPLDAVSENESDVDEDKNEDDDESEDPMKNYLHRDMYEGAEGEDHKIHLEQGMIFENVDKFREVLRDYVVQEGFLIVRLKNERTRVTCKCAADGCSWRIHASPLSDKVTFAIKSLKAEHTCVRVKTMKEANSSWMSKRLLQVLRENPDMKARGIRHELQKYGIDPPYMQLYRAKKKALEQIDGSYGDSYSRLPHYAEMVRRSNHGSIVKLQYNHDENDDELVSSIPVVPSFKRIFVGLDALKKGFLQGCSPFLGFDGCHLKGPYGGVLLAAIGLDGNNGLFPLAFAIVESECKDWCFFFQALDEMLGGFDVDRPWTFMSDRQKGLLECINDMVPHAINRRHAFPIDLKNDHVTNNIAESFNAWIGEFRGKPIMTLLEGVRTKVMSMVHKRHEKGLKWTKEIMPNILKKANEQMEWSRHCNLHVASQTEFEVLDKNVSYRVNLHRMSCDCRIWDLSGIPCRHACLAISHQRDNIEVYTDRSFSKEKYMMAYTHVIHPIPDVKFWKNLDDVQPSTILPPPLRRLPGRPRKSRRKETGEQSNVRAGMAMRCTICHEMDIEADVPLSQVLENMSRNKRSRQSRTSSTAIAEEMPYIPQLHHHSLAVKQVWMILGQTWQIILSEW
ncbi:UNVERIFIED_CONTAM: hypothetical protein Sradi_4088800 [Sesamum radiatum]|uniref:SWIM-type domain-containing protein n=1 Tax=Sesamum radiatum TaxID=300843 RepID=A0AAW2PJQ8_SESRA